MLLLSAFADEISARLDTSLECLAAHGIRHVELRSVDGINVLNLSEETLAAVREELADHSFSVSSIGSPIGKVRLDSPWEERLAGLHRALNAAKVLSAPFVRLFSYYPPGESFSRADRDEIVRRLREQAAIAAEVGVTLLHENEKKIYGDTGRRCAELIRAVDDAHFKAAFDFANFVEVGDDPLSCWKMLKSNVAYFHVKDCRQDTKKIVPAGQGDGRIREILEDAVQGRFEGFLCLEPHLSAAGQSGGFTGINQFADAVGALTGILDEIGCTYC